jgi:hypothetical protein
MRGDAKDEKEIGMSWIYHFGLPFSYSSFILLTRTLFLVQKNKILKLWLTYGKCLRLEATNAHHGEIIVN